MIAELTVRKFHIPQERKIVCSYVISLARWSGVRRFDCLIVVFVYCLLHAVKVLTSKNASAVEVAPLSLIVYLPTGKFLAWMPGQ